MITEIQKELRNHTKIKDLDENVTQFYWHITPAKKESKE
jgi:hypothetical protein